MTSRHHARAAPLIGLCLLLASIALPADAASPRSQLQHDRAACQRMPAGDRHQDCLSEASTAFAATQPSAAGEDAASLSRNALRRCERLSEPDRGHCRDRMNGKGTTSGSVSGGGIFRELIVIEPAPTPAPPKAP